jgi:hypothetical protein
LRSIQRVLSCANDKMWIGEMGLPRQDGEKATSLSQSQMEVMKTNERVDRDKDDIDTTGGVGWHSVSIN